MLVVVSLLAGILIGYWIFYGQGYASAISFCRVKLESIGLSRPKAEAIKVASGKIVSVSGDRIDLEIYPPADLLSDGSRAVPFRGIGLVNGNTTILSRSLDLSRIRKVTSGGIPISPFVDKIISISGLVPGMIIDIVAESDLSSNREFILNKVVVNEKP